MKPLLIVAHAPSENTRRLVDALLRGAQAMRESLEIRLVAPLEAGAEDVLQAGAVLLATPENLGYMSGAMKDFFDRIYYPCLERTEGLPYALMVRAGHDGTGTCRAVQSITGGLRWRAVREPLVCRGPFREEFVEACEELGGLMAAGLEAGIF